MATRYNAGKTLYYIHDGQLVRELRLAATVMQETTGQVTVVDLLERAAERIEWLSDVVAHRDLQQKSEGKEP